MIKPVTISIKGDFIDSQIYSGRLYLWHFNGKLSIYDWNKLINQIDTDTNDQLAIKYSFMNGAFLYKVHEMFDDEEFKNLILKKIKRISNKEYVINDKVLEDCKIYENDTPTGILPIDTEIYNNVLYCLTEKGLFSSKIENNKSSKKKLKKEIQISDIMAFSIKANLYPQIVISAGEEGVFEYYVNDNIDRIDVNTLKQVEYSLFQVSESHSTFANYVNRSIYSTSLIGKSKFLDYEWDKNRNVYFRNQKSDKDSFEIFDDRDDDRDINVSWGVDDKIYKISNEEIKYRRVSNISNQSLNVEKINIRDKIKQNYGNVIGASSSHFGTIIEYENALLVLCSDGEKFDINGEIVNWRVFPRSKCYQNQLHVILNDRIKIYSFSHDYFLDQIQKDFGICFRP